MPHQNDLAEIPEMVMQQPMDVACHRLLVISEGRFRRMTCASIIWRNDPEACINQRRYGVAPRAPGLGKSVEENRRPRPFTSNHIVDADARLDVRGRMSG